MNWKRKNSSKELRLGGLALLAMALASSGLFGVRLANAAAGKGLDVEIAYEIKALKITGATSPVYVQVDNGKLIFSDAAGLVSSAPLGDGSATPIAKVPHPAGLAIAPAGFGSYAGQIFVLSSADLKDPCAVVRIDKGSATAFAKLPDAGKLNGGKATECRDLEFGTAGTPFAGKLYAVTNGNGAIYEIASSGKVRPFITFDGKPSYDVTSISFSAANDPKAPKSILAGLRPRGEIAAKVGRIEGIDAAGNDKVEYQLGLINPTGWAYAPDGFGEYTGNLFMVDMGRPAAKNDAARDGRVTRLDNKGVERSFATGLVDPNCLRISGKTMVIADPSGQGKLGKGWIVVINSML